MPQIQHRVVVCRRPPPRRSSNVYDAVVEAARLVSPPANRARRSSSPKKGRPTDTQSSAKSAVRGRAGHARTANQWVKVMSNSRAAVRRQFQSRSGNNPTKTGNLLPRYSTAEVAQGQAEVLQLRFSELKSSAKRLANAAGTSERAARNHLAGINAMNLTDFFNACKAIPELRAWGARMMGLEAEHDPRFQEELANGMRQFLRRGENER